MADPLGGSFYVEALTSQMEEAAERVIREVEQLGGMTEAIISGEGRPLPEAVHSLPVLVWARWGCPCSLQACETGSH